MIASAARPEPKEVGVKVVRGKIQGSWVNVTALAEALKEPVGAIAQLWESYMEA